MGKDTRIGVPTARASFDAGPEDDDGVVTVKVNLGDEWETHRLVPGQNLVVSDGEGTPLAIVDVDHDV